MLDPRGREEVMEIVSDLNRRLGITVVLITHHMDEAAPGQRGGGPGPTEKSPPTGGPGPSFPQVELLHRLGLSAPETVELCWRLRELGEEVPGYTHCGRMRAGTSPLGVGLTRGRNENWHPFLRYGTCPIFTASEPRFNGPPLST